MSLYNKGLHVLEFKHCFLTFIFECILQNALHPFTAWLHCLFIVCSWQEEKCIFSLQNAYHHKTRRWEWNMCTVHLLLIYYIPYLTRLIYLYISIYASFRQCCKSGSAWICIVWETRSRSKPGSASEWYFGCGFASKYKFRSSEGSKWGHGGPVCQLVACRYASLWRWAGSWSTSTWCVSAALHITLYTIAVFPLTIRREQ